MIITTVETGASTPESENRIGDGDATEQGASGTVSPQQPTAPLSQPEPEHQPGLVPAAGVSDWITYAAFLVGHLLFPLNLFGAGWAFAAVADAALTSAGEGGDVRRSTRPERQRLLSRRSSVAPSFPLWWVYSQGHKMQQFGVYLYYAVMVFLGGGYCRTVEAASCGHVDRDGKPLDEAQVAAWSAAASDKTQVFEVEMSVDCLWRVQVKKKPAYFFAYVYHFVFLTLLYWRVLLDLSRFLRLAYLASPVVRHLRGESVAAESKELRLHWLSVENCFRWGAVLAKVGRLDERTRRGDLHAGTGGASSSGVEPQVLGQPVDRPGATPSSEVPPPQPATAVVQGAAPSQGAGVTTMGAAVPWAEDGEETSGQQGPEADSSTCLVAFGEALQKPPRLSRQLRNGRVNELVVRSLPTVPGGSCTTTTVFRYRFALPDGEDREGSLLHVLLFVVFHVSVFWWLLPGEGWSDWKSVKLKQRDGQPEVDDTGRPRAPVEREFFYFSQVLLLLPMCAVAILDYLGHLRLGISPTTFARPRT